MLHCILCGSPFTSDITEPAEGERHVTLVCAAHSDEALRARDLDELWGGEDLMRSPACFTGGERKIVAAWEWPGFGVYALLDDGELLMLVSWGGGEVRVARVPRGERALERPLGFPECRREPWATAVREGWTLSAVRRLDAELVTMEFPGQGELAFMTWMESWRELGDGYYFIDEAWLAGDACAEGQSSRWPRFPAG